MLLIATAFTLATQAPAGWTPFVQSFDAFAARDSIVGGSVALVRPGRPITYHVSGFGDRARNQRVTEETIFHWGSITKTLTAVAIMQLRDRGRLTLDDRVTRWIPELRQVNNRFGSMDDITIRMLLSHTSGFQNPTWPYRQYEAWEPFEPTRWEQLVSMMPYQRIAFAPGSRWGYSNPAFIYLARIIEAITNDPYQSYIYKNIWTPLGMTRSYFNTTPYHLEAARSNNYTLTRDSLVTNGRDFDPGITIPNGGWNAPLGDLITWINFLSGRTPSTVLSRPSVEEMFRSVVAVDSSTSFGLSFYVHNGIIGHTGEQAGFRSFFYLDPRTGNAVVGVFNTTNDRASRESNSGFAALLPQARTLLR